MKRTVVIILILLMMINVCVSCSERSPSIENNESYYTIPIVTNNSIMDNSSFSSETTDIVSVHTDLTFDNDSGMITGIYNIPNTETYITVDAKIITENIPDQLNRYTFSRNPLSISNSNLFFDIGDAWTKVVFADRQIAIGENSEGSKQISDISIDYIISSFCALDPCNISSWDLFLEGLPSGFDVCDYALRYEYPVEDDWQFELLYADSWEPVAGFGSDNFSCYSVRQQLDSIPVGYSDDIMSAGKTVQEWDQTESVFVGAPMMNRTSFYNGADIVNVCCYPELFEGEVEIVTEDLRILPIEDCFDSCYENILMEMGYGPNGFLNGQPLVDDIRIYAVELVYLAVVEQDTSTHNAIPDNSGNTEMTLSPFWLVYFQSGVSTGRGIRSASIIDAVTGMAIV